MKRTHFGLVVGATVGLLLGLAPHVDAEPLTYRSVEEPKVVLIEVTWTEEQVVALVDRVSVEYGVSSETMKAVIQCESSFRRKAVGDGGKSRGLVQIHQDFHEVTDEQAFDPEFAVRFLAEHIRDGKGSLWTCYRKLIK